MTALKVDAEENFWFGVSSVLPVRRHDGLSDAMQRDQTRKRRYLITRILKHSGKAHTRKTVQSTVT